LISAFTPTHGTVGTSVAIAGSGFTGASAVRFNGAAAVFTVTSDTAITAAVPATASTGKIAVVVSGTVSRSSSPFYVVPTISRFSPTSGTIGTSVAITGTGFTHATKVLFSGIAATYTVASPTKINASVPPGATTGKITVRTAGGSATSTTNFTILTSALTTKPHR
jgi:large repetitive protein